MPLNPVDATPQRGDRLPQAQLLMSKADQIIRDAEAAKARIFEVQGNNSHLSAILDENYLAIGSHVEESLRKKIGVGEYVDFAKLMPKDKVNNEEDNRMEMVNKGGMSF